MSAIAERIEEFRLPEESSRAFSRRAGVSIVTLLAVVRGNEPKDRTLETIATNLGTTAVYLRYGIKPS